MVTIDRKNFTVKTVHEVKAIKSLPHNAPWKEMIHKCAVRSIHNNNRFSVRALDKKTKWWYHLIFDIGAVKQVKLKKNESHKIRTSRMVRTK